MGLLGDAWDATKHYVLGQTSGPPGTAGAAGAGDNLHLDPTTGLWMDPSNGQTYQDQYGMQPVGNVNSAQQTGADFATQQALLARTQAAQQQQQAGFAGQQGLAASLNGVINGAGPSVAAAQLGQGLGAIGQEQQSQAAGVSGAAAPLAKLMAAQNTGAAQVATNQAQGLARAQEVQGARNQLGQAYTNMAQEGQAGYNANLSGAGGFAHTAASLAGGREGTDEDRQKHDADAAGKAVSGGGSALTMLAA